MENIIYAKRVVQNNQEFLIGVFKISQILKFTRYTERLIVGFYDVDGDEKVYSDQSQISPAYNAQIQRTTNKSKVEKIADFLITDPMAMFPTNIVIAIPRQVIDLQLDETSGNTKIVLNSIVEQELQKENGDVFLTIVDGQHRIRGIERALERLKDLISDDNNDIEVSNKYEKIYQKLLDLELMVTFFIDPILEYQAMIFSTINKTQTKVPENLVYSLFGLTKNDTPQKTSLEVVLALNGIEKSPFFNRIKLVGGNYKRGESIPLSQATMVKSILFQISKNLREAEIERNKNRADLKTNPNELVFRPYYAYNNDRMIVRIIYSFFSAVRDTLKYKNGKSFWDFDSTPTLNVLQTNIGFQALIRLLFDILKIADENEKDSKEFYVKNIEKLKNIDFEDNNPEKKYPFTSKSIKLLYLDMKNAIGI